MLKELGTIEFKETITVTDPCYDHDVWCRLDNVKIRPGTYNCAVVIDPKEEYPFIKEILIASNDLSEDIDLKKADWDTVGIIGVDAGLAGFFENKPDFSDEEWKAFCDELSKKDETSDIRAYFYEDKEKNAKGFFSSSGWGDGSYEVFGFYEKDNDYASALRIIFLIF